MRSGAFYMMISLLFSGCSITPEGNEKDDMYFMEGVDTTPVADMHTSQIALDYTGTYTGLLPCGDCDGIEAAIVLFEDGTFEKSLHYLGRDEDVLLSSEGSYLWEASGGVVRLEGDHGFTRFMVAENFLVHLEGEADRFSGDRGEHYVLQKIPE